MSYLGTLLKTWILVPLLLWAPSVGWGANTAELETLFHERLNLPWPMARTLGSVPRVQLAYQIAQAEPRIPELHVLESLHQLGCAALVSQEVLPLEVSVDQQIQAFLNRVKWIASLIPNGSTQEAAFEHLSRLHPQLARAFLLDGHALPVSFRYFNPEGPLDLSVKHSADLVASNLSSSRKGTFAEIELEVHDQYDLLSQSLGHLRTQYSISIAMSERISERADVRKNIQMYNSFIRDLYRLYAAATTQRDLEAVALYAQLLSFELASFGIKRTMPSWMKAALHDSPDMISPFDRGLQVLRSILISTRRPMNLK